MADDPERARRKPPTPGSDDVLARLGLTGAGAAGTAGGRAARRRAAEEAKRSPDDTPEAPETSKRGRANGGGPADPRRTAGPARADADRTGRRNPADRTGDLTPTDRAAPTGRVGGRALVHRAGPPDGRTGDSAAADWDPDRANGLAPADRAGRTPPADRADQDDLPTRVLPIAKGQPPRGTPPAGPRYPAAGGARPADGPGARPSSFDTRPRSTAAPVNGAARPPSRDTGLRNDATRAVRRPDAAPSSRSSSPNGSAAEVRRIDETLTRMTLAHAGLTLDGKRDEPEEEQDDRPPRRRPSLLRLVALAVTAVIVAAGGVGWGAQRWLGSAVRTAAALDPGSGAIVDPAKQAGAENVLVVATDRAATPGAAARPDTVVVAHLSASATKGAAGPLTVLSIPTDLEVSRPPCERYDAASATYTTDTVPAQARTQLASALDLGGPRCATRAVQQLTGLAITRYVGIDLERLGAAVDAVSGVRVCTPRAVVDATLGPVAPTPGSIVLDARKATDYTSAAAVAGDPPAGQGRIERQQQVLAAVLGSALSQTGLLDLPRLRTLRPVLGAALATDGADLDQVLALARSMHDLGAGGVTFATVPTDPDPTGGSVLRATDAAAMFDALRTDAALPAPAAGQQNGLKPSDLQVQVRNASERPGLAAKIADTLRGLGFGVGAVTNADQPTPQTLIHYSPDQTGAAQLLAATVPAATTVADPGATGVLELVLGRSFDGVVRAPTSAPTAQAAGPTPAPVSCA